MPVEPVHRGILAADIEGFSRPERSNPLRVRMRDALYRLIGQSLTRAGIESWHGEETDHGDCVLILFDANIPKTRLLDPFVPRLATALSRHNRSVATAERLRLRVVIHAGELLRDTHGHTGEDLNAAFRLLDSDALHRCLAEAPGDLAVIVSDAIYQAIVKHGYRGIDPAGYRQVTVIAKETNTTAWVHRPPPGRRTDPSRRTRAPAPRSRAAATRGPPSIPTPTQLPAAAVAFTGRRRELRRLRQLLEAAGRRQGVAVAAIHGIGGVGKSTLAVHAAHKLAAEFPDGQLYVDLRGSSPEPSPMAPQEAIGRFLRALGVAGEDVPVELEEAAARLRSLLAGRRVLTVLDNAADVDQVQPLLPTTPGSAALVTSRQGLFALEGAVHTHLDVLSLEESVLLLRRLASSERVVAEPSAARTIAVQCGHLPLALRIAGARLAARPSWPLRALAEQLADERRRLDRLRLGHLAVRASFELSYQGLLDADGGSLAARAFRLLGLLDGPDVSIPVAAALVDQPPVEVEAVLERLVDAQMLESPTPGRYRLHDLLRLFAAELATEQERASVRRAAVRRVLRWYLATAQRANSLVAPPDLRHGGASDAGGLAFEGSGEALAWLEVERANLLAAARQAAPEAEPLATVTIELSKTLFWLLQARGYWRDWAEIGELALKVTRRLGDRTAEVLALSDLAGAHHRLGRDGEAISCLEQALRIHRELGDTNAEANLLSNLGIAYREAGRLDEAISACERSLAISREQADRYGEATVLNNLSKVYHQLERFEESIAICNEALSVFEELGDAYGQGNVLANLGESYRVAGRADEAVDCCQRSLRLFRQVADLPDQAEALLRLGRALHALGQIDQAHASWREALTIFEGSNAPQANEVRKLLPVDSPDP